MPTTMETLRFLLVATIAILIASPPLPITHSAPDATNHTYFLPAPNANESLFHYKLFRHPEFDFSYATRNDTNSSFGSNVYCNDPKVLLETLNTDLGIYGRSTSIVSAHDWIERYTVYFQVYFVTSVDDVWRRENPSDNHYYLSVVAMNWYGKVRDPNRGQVIWTANPGKPVDINACLNLTESGDLTLRYSNGTVAWYADVGTSTRSSLFFTYEGNLVLYANDSRATKDEQTNILWQTYDNPTDTLMVLQGLKNGVTLCTSNNLNYSNSSAFFSMDVVNGTIRLYVDSNRCEETESEKGYVYWSYNMSSNASDVKQNTSLVVCWPDPKNATLIRLMAPAQQSALAGSLKSTQIDAEACGTATMALPDGFPEPWSKNDSNIADITYATFVRLDPDGDLSVYTVNDTSYPDSSATWTNVYSAFGARKCELPLYCGFYGVCDSTANICMKECANGLGDTNLSQRDDTNKTWLLNESSNNRSGCSLSKSSGHLELPNNDRCPPNVVWLVEAARIDGARYFMNHSSDVPNFPSDESDCWARCAATVNCSSCTAAFWEGDRSGADGTCFHITGNVGTIWWDPNAHGVNRSVAYIKYFVQPPPPPVPTPPPPAVPPPPSHIELAIGLSIGTLLPVLILLALAICYYVKRRARISAASELEAELLQVVSLALPMGINQPGRFRWKELHEYTCGFSDVLGRGGSGQVFRGSLPDGTPIAVKQLLHIAGSVYEGDKAFVAELAILSKIHHLHLVQLIGFCLEGKHKLLVYEYMENGSLDAWLFHKGVDTQQPTDDATSGRAPTKTQEKGKLSWEKRLSIAVGSAKGLAYLHEECEERVIHMDMKPQNILLDSSFMPKISDFGMSKRIGRDYSYVATVMRGTPGYLAPEWLTDGAVTVKCDVYSFGIVLLEMVSGRRVKDLMARQQKLDLRSGWSGLGDGWMEEMVDEELMGEMVGKWEEARRMVEVAMLCVQREQERRPSMSSVVQMLEGKADIPQLMVDHELGLFPSFLLRMTRENSEGSQEMDSLLLHSSFLRSDDDESASAGNSRSSRGSKGRSWRYVRRPNRMSSLNVELRTAPDGTGTSMPAAGHHLHH